MIVWRPILAEPPVYGLADVRRLTMSEILDANEALDLRLEIAERAAARAKNQR